MYGVRNAASTAGGGLTKGLAWLLLGKPRSLPTDVSALLSLEPDESGEWNAAISAEFVNAYPEIAARVIKTLLNHKVRVYYTPVSLPNLLLRNGRVFEILGSSLREFKEIDARAVLYDLKWSLTRKYLKVSGIVETIDAGDHTDILIRLRDQYGYRNVILDSAEGQDVKIGDSLEIVGSYFIGAADVPYLEAVWIEKRNSDVVGLSRSGR